MHRLQRSCGCLFFAIVLASVAPSGASPQDKPQTKSVEEVVNSYLLAVGGRDAVARVKTRELEAVQGHRKAHLSWQAPDRVLWVEGPEREGFDGSTSWYETKRKRVQKLSSARKDEIETDANPIRFVYLRDMYRDLEVAPRASLDGEALDVLRAPNSIGATQFFFDAHTHLLVRIEELGIQSAYYKHTIDFEKYQAFDGVKIPTLLIRNSDEPSSEEGKLRLLRIQQNRPLNAEVFRKPDIGAIISGGKH